MEVQRLNPQSSCKVREALHWVAQERGMDISVASELDRLMDKLATTKQVVTERVPGHMSCKADFERDCARFVVDHGMELRQVLNGGGE